MPFYHGVIAPHALVALGRAYCAFQNTTERPIVMAYTPERKAPPAPLARAYAYFLPGSQWFINALRRPSRLSVGCAVFLWHAESNFASHEGGPAGVGSYVMRDA